MTPRPVPYALPANPVSIADGLAAVTISPFTRDLTKAEKATILAADRQRVYVCACGDAEPSQPGVPVKLSDYPVATLKWCVQHASLICYGLIECRHPSEKDIEALLSRFDRDDVADHRFVIRLIVDARSGVADDVWYQRPCEPPPFVHPIETQALQ
jgi:hypothetical protein